MRSKTCSPEPPRRTSGFRPTHAAGLLALAAVASAHDCWIEPARWEPEVEEPLELHLLVGDDFSGEPRPRNEERIVRLRAEGPGGAAGRIVGLDGRAPLGVFRPSVGGLWRIGYENTPAFLRLPAGEFEAYLHEVGLEHVLEQRRRAGREDAPGRERYSRCAVSLVAVGGDRPAEAAGFPEPMGLPLELVPLGDPSRGERVDLRLLFEGEPLEGALVRARSDARPRDPVHARTDGEGRASLRLDSGSVVLVTAVHMVPLEGDPDADWRSYWASLTWARGETSGRARSASAPR